MIKNLQNDRKPSRMIKNLQNDRKLFWHDAKPFSLSAKPSRFGDGELCHHNPDWKIKQTVQRVISWLRLRVIVVVLIVIVNA
jgi:hypothetical protein